MSGTNSAGFFTNIKKKPVKNIPNKSRVLICMIGNARGGEKAWNSFYEHMLQKNNADLAILFGQTYNKSSSLYSRAKYVWEFPEYENWKYPINDIVKNNNWVNKLPQDQTNSGLWGGVNNFNGSGAIIFCIREFLKKHIETVLSKYDRFVITRSDHFYLDHILIDDLDPNFIWIPEGEDYGGITDRHHIFNKNIVLQGLDILNPLIHSVLNNQNLGNNPETVIKNIWSKKKIFTKIRRFPRTFFTCAQKGDTSRWCQPGHILPEGINCKYLSEYCSSHKNIVLNIKNKIMNFHVQDTSPIRIHSHERCMNRDGFVYVEGKGGYIEMVIDFPEGSLEFSLCFNSVENRPVKIFIDNKLIDNNFINDKTGSYWDMNKVKWCNPIIINSSGRKTIRLETDGYFPHLWSARIRKITEIFFYDIRIEKLDICIVSTGGAGSNSLVSHLNLIKTIDWINIFCHFPTPLFSKKCKIIYLYNKSLENIWKSTTRQNYLQTNFNKMGGIGEVTNEKFIEKVKNQMINWLDNIVKIGNDILILETNDLFTTEGSDFISKFIGRNIKPLKYRNRTSANIKMSLKLKEFIKNTTNSIDYILSKKTPRIKNSEENKKYKLVEFKQGGYCKLKD